MDSNINRAESPEVSPPGYVNILPEITEQPQQPYDEDDHSGEIREYNGVFEGPEKTLGKKDKRPFSLVHFSCNSNFFSHTQLFYSKQRSSFASYPPLKAT